MSPAADTTSFGTGAGTGFLDVPRGTPGLALICFAICHAANQGVGCAIDRRGHL